MNSGELAVSLPDTGRVVTHWSIPIVVQRGALVMVGLIVVLAAAFALINLCGRRSRLPRPQ